MNDIKTGEDNLSMGMYQKELHNLNYSDIKDNTKIDDIYTSSIFNILYDLKNAVENLKESLSIIKEKLNINDKKDLINECNYRKQKICKTCKYFDDSGYDEEVNDYCTKIDWYVDENGICDFYEDKNDENKITCESCIFFKDNYCSKLNSRTIPDRHCDFYEKK